MTTATIPGLISRRTARARGRLDQELIVDNFAGAGGASVGIEAALGRCVDLAINHDAVALDIHQINHPETEHLVTDVWDVDPVEAAAGRPVGLAWFSPDCTHFSVARGGKPKKKRIRSLAWIVVKWARAVRPRVIILENVREFQTWGPLDARGRVVEGRAGETFRRWKGQLLRLGYQVECRELVAADYGAPTIRRRFFCVARCDGRAIRWPERTHAPRGKAEALGLKPWRSAAECIDWSLPCPSIFERRRPLAEATLRRIAAGLRRFVLEAAEPFIVVCNHGGPEFRGQSAAEPMATLTAARDAHGVVVPCVTAIDHRASDRPVSAACEPLRTITQENRFALVNAFLTAYHGLAGGEARGGPADGPLPTQDTQNRFGLVAAFLAKHYGGVVGSAVAGPLGTVTAVDHHSLVAAHLQANNTDNPARSPEAPLGAVTTGGRHMLAASCLTKLYGTARDGQDVRQPVPTITGGGNHVAEVRAFLVKYFGTGRSKDPREPLDTVTGKDRFGLVRVEGVDYQIRDIGLRMLTPKELLRAQFGRFADEYVLVGTKSRQVAAIGNSVCPEVAETLVRANMENGHAQG